VPNRQHVSFLGLLGAILTVGALMVTSGIQLSRADTVVDPSSLTITAASVSVSEVGVSGRLTLPTADAATNQLLHYVVSDRSGQTLQVSTIDTSTNGYYSFTDYPPTGLDTLTISWAGTADNAASSATTTVLIGDPGSFWSLPPTRVLDTRTGNGAPAGAVSPGGTVTLSLWGRGGVPSSQLVAGVVLNVTATQPTTSGYLNVYPGAETPNAMANVNFSKGQTVANLVVVAMDTFNGTVKITNRSGGTVQIVADVSGYSLSFYPNSSSYSDTPGGLEADRYGRILDTRVGLGAPAHAVAAGATVHIAVPTVANGSLIHGATAVILNVTVTQPKTAGYLTVYPDGTAKPTASNLNFVKDQTVPNLVIARLGADGKVAMTNSSGGTVQIVADVYGFFMDGPPIHPGTFGALSPSRLLDTRNGTGAPARAVSGGSTIHLAVLGRGGVPRSGVSAVALNVTVTKPGGSGYLTVYPDGTARPLASNFNFSTNQTVSNLVVVPVGPDGMVSLTNGSGAAVSIIGDVSGYWTS
jgi:hypothetical protein